MADGTERRLEVTARCLEEDLGLLQSVAWRDHADTVPVLRAFRDRRGQSPEGTEPIEDVLRVLRSAPIFSLHSGNDRAGTWHDEEEDVVWLVGVGRAHDYDHLVGLASRGRLLPTDEDYQRLEADLPDQFELETMGRHARTLVQKALSDVGQIFEGVLGGRISVRVCVESLDPPLLTVALSERIAPGVGRIPETWKYLVAQAFYPTAGFPIDFLPFAEEIDRDAVRANELALVNFIDETV
jgi:hypothetical protein